MLKYVTLFLLKNKKSLKKRQKALGKGLKKFFRFMVKTYENLEFFQINKTLTDRAYLIVLLIIFVFQFSFPRYSGMAIQTARETLNGLETAILNSLPQAPERQFRTIYVTATAYTSTVGQTDSTPCVTANQFDLCQHNEENIIACNFLTFGTKVVFPDIDPNKVYLVQDRMHYRFPYRVDFWMKDTQQAKSFGVQTLKMKIYDN